ncbi:pyruvate ferredoxin oxidoreductase [candidate division MSBL1 archaeon SCGC-AAA261G05]|uniref:Pyruvate ferredoxin oxidoreductase n=2 Tax=candidate division MSBL1 TaxID=215777 RepID=A0A133UZA4_9EURY|nr:pyruvate ferredoxin oxidoreductase [candidate division MSBL1 archaeon SCGC-AAA261C02]KXB02992.1 pyruvate ferredoxin oxidoreductase [candidate division MSBL1 archaeon SCGC-AAA261G05]
MASSKLSHEGDLYNAGHRACPGCGAALACKYVTEATGPNTIMAMATGCMEVTSTPYPESAWGISWIHNIFENSAAVAAGIETAYKAFKKRGKKGYTDYDDINFVVLAGDGATFDIGIRSLSGMMERGHNVLYICYDNEAYMNTGIQRSGSTPLGASTTTSPPGKESFGEDIPKKDMPAIAAAHGCKYVATASIAYSEDFKNKIEKALKIDGPKYIQVTSPCPRGWRSDASKTIEIARLAVETGAYPLFEMEDGEITNVKKIKDRKPVEKYLELQGRFKHLFKMDGGEKIIQRIQEIADSNADRYGIDK